MAERRQTESPHDVSSCGGRQRSESRSDPKSPSLGVWLFLVPSVTVPVRHSSDIKQRLNNYLSHRSPQHANSRTKRSSVPAASPTPGRRTRSKSTWEPLCMGQTGSTCQACPGSVIWATTVDQGDWKTVSLDDDQAVVE